MPDSWAYLPLNPDVGSPYPKFSMRRLNLQGGQVFLPRWVSCHPLLLRFATSGSLSGLKEIGCKSVWLVYISPLFRPIEQLLAFKIVTIHPHPITFSLRFFKSDRLLAVGFVEYRRIA